MKMFPKLISSTGADIVFIQETWGELGKQLTDALAKEGYTNKIQLAEYNPPKFNARDGVFQKELTIFGEQLWRPFTKGLDFGFGRRYRPVWGEDFFKSTYRGIARYYSSVLDGRFWTFAEDEEDFRFAEYGLSLISDIKKIRTNMGNGLLIVSKEKFKIADSSECKTEQMRFHKYTTFDEVFTMKGAIKTCVEIPGVGIVELYNSHLGAADWVAGDKTKAGYFDAEMDSKRAIQAKELANFINETHDPNRPMIAGISLGTHYFKVVDGEFDPQQLSTEYSYMVGDAKGRVENDNEDTVGFIDTFAAVHYNKKGSEYSYLRPAYTGNADENEAMVEYGWFADEPKMTSDHIFVSPNNSFVPSESELFLNEDITDDTLAKVGIDVEQLLQSAEAASYPKRLVTHYGVLTTFEVK